MKSESFEIAALEDEFQDALSRWHAEQGYQLDFMALAQARGIEVIESETAPSLYIHAKRRIVLNSGEGVRRQRHTRMHELSHHLLYELDEGAFVQRVERLAHARARAAKDLMEQLCKRGGRELAVPRPFVNDVFLRCPDDAERAMKLAIRCKVSLALAGQRIADLERSRAVWGVVLSKSGIVVDCFGNDVKNAKYKTGVGHQLPYIHALRQPFTHMRLEFFRAPIPFKFSKKQMPRHMQAMADELRGQTIVFFNSRAAVGRAMTPLFEL